MKKIGYGPSNLVKAIYLTPGILIYTLAVFVPVAGAIYYSFFNWTGGPKKVFSGLANYQEMLTDKLFWSSFRNNLVLTLVCIIGQIGLAFLFSSILQSRLTKLKSIHRAFAYFPVTVSAVVVGFVWSMIYDYNYGMLNTFLKIVGFGQFAKPWLSQSDFIMLKVSIPIIWQYIGLYLVIILAAYSSINKEVFEMAELDGANGLKQALYITIPLIRNSLIVCLMLCISGNMKAFDHIFVMTNGGPGTSSTVMAMYAYQTAFLKYRMGYGTTLSIGILILSLALVLFSRLILQRLSSKEVE